MENLIEELRTCAATLSRIAATLSDADEKAAEPQKAAPMPMDEPVPEQERDATVLPQLTLEEVRTTLAELSRNGLTAEVREIIKKHGADRLSGLDTAEYAAVLKEAKSLGS